MAAGCDGTPVLDDVMTGILPATFVIGLKASGQHFRLFPGSQLVHVTVSAVLQGNPTDFAVKNAA